MFHGYKNIARQLVRLYPRHWRDRYEEEFVAMLEEQSISPLDGLDLLLGILDAHLHPHLGTTAMSLSERMRQMLSTLNRSLLTLFCAFGGFILAGIGFQKLTEDSDFMNAAQAHSIVGLSFHLVVGGSIVAALATLIGGLPIIAAIIRDTLTRKRYGQLLLLATPLLSLAAFISIILLLKALIPLRASIHQIYLGRGIFVAIFLGSAIVSVAALCLATVRSHIAPKLLRFAVLPSYMLTLAMILMLAATITWGLNLASTVPQLFNSDRGLFGTSTSATWLHIVIVMAIATVLATISLIRSRSASAALQSPAN